MNVEYSSSNDTQSILGWMASERLYEEFLFFYVLIIAFWVFVGLLSLGFVVDGYSLQRNLFFNFICFLLLAACIAATPFWYRLIFGRGARLQRRSQEIAEQVAAIEDPVKRQAIQQHLANNGELPPRTAQKWALIFLGWCVLFEIFFISAWVKDLALVWQPAWVDAIIGWVRGHLNLRPLNEDRDIFILAFEKNPENEAEFFLENKFKNEQNFLKSSFSDVVMLFHFWRVVVFFPIFISVSLLLWKPIYWLGLDRIDPGKIKNFKNLFFALIVSVFMPILVFGGFLSLFMDVGDKAYFVLGKKYWISVFWNNFGFVLMVVGTRFLVGWFVFCKRVFLNLYKRVRK